MSCWLEKARAVAAMLLALALAAGVLARPLAASAKEDVSIAAASAAVAGGFGKAVANKNKDCAEYEKLAGRAGSAGALLGFVDPEFSDFVGWLKNKLTLGSDSVSMDMLDKMECGGDHDKVKGLSEFARYGATLGALGLDNTSSGFSSIGRMIMGWTALGFFYLATGVDKLFGLPIWLASYFNVFSWFAGLGTVPAFEPVANMLNRLYTTVLNFGWGLAVPLLTMFALFSWLALGKHTGASAIKAVMVRVLFLVLGVPVMGTLVTATLDSLVDFDDTGGATAQVVATRWVDFEAWVKHSRLGVGGLPEHAIEWEAGTGKPSNQSWQNLDTTVLKINQQSMGVNFGEYAGSPANVEDVRPVGAQVMNDSAKNAWWAANSLLLGYAKGDTISAGEYASMVQTEVTKDDVLGLKKDPNKALTTNPLTNDGHLVVRGAHGVRTAAQDGGDDGLSRLAMYNYLTTKFHETKIDTFSPPASGSVHTMLVHNSVALAGGPVLGLLNWLSADMIWLSYAIVGIGYGVSIFMTVLVRFFKLVVSIPTAMFGSVRAIAKVISSVLVVVSGTLATTFLYMLFKAMLSVFLPLVNAAIVEFNGDGPGATGWTPNGVVAMVIAQIIGIVMMVALVIVALRVRGGVVGTLEEIMDGIVEKIVPAPMFNTEGKRSGAGQMVAQGVGARIGDKVAGAGVKRPSAAGEKKGQPSDSSSSGGGSSSSSGGDSSSSSRPSSSSGSSSSSDSSSSSGGRSSSSSGGGSSSSSSSGSSSSSSSSSGGGSPSPVGSDSSPGSSPSAGTAAGDGSDAASGPAAPGADEAAARRGPAPNEAAAPAGGSSDERAARGLSAVSAAGALARDAARAEKEERAKEERTRAERAKAEKGKAERGKAEQGKPRPKRASAARPANGGKPNPSAKGRRATQQKAAPGSQQRPQKTAQQRPPKTAQQRPQGSAPAPRRAAPQTSAPVPRQRPEKAAPASEVGAWLSSKAGSRG